MILREIEPEKCGKCEVRSAVRTNRSVRLRKDNLRPRKNRTEKTYPPRNASKEVKTGIVLRFTAL
jgi:hypothetical protein